MLNRMLFSVGYTNLNMKGMGINMAMQFSDEERKKMERDKSEIYTKRTEETYAEYVKSLKGKRKGRYFADYYLQFVVIAIVIIAVAVLVIRNAVATPPAIVLSVALDSDVVSEENIGDFEEKIEEVLELDKERERVYIYCSSDNQQLQTYLYTSEVDVVISDEESFKKWAESGYFFEPSSDEEVKFYNEYPEDVKYYSTYISAEDIRESEKIEDAVSSDGTEYNYGIYLTNTDKYSKELEGHLKNPVAGISAASKNAYYAEAFIKYMTEVK